MKGKPTELTPLFSPASIAVVGASTSPEKAGYQMLAALDRFPGDLYPINPRATEILGRNAYPAVSAVPNAVDLAILAVPAAATPAVLSDCAAASVRAALICSGGFGEAGAEGASLQAEIRAIARATGLRVLGPNTSGFVNPLAEVRAVFLPSVGELRPGRLAVVAQSGGVNLAAAFLAHSQGQGIRLAVGLGNALDVGFAEVLDYLAGDEDTAAIALHLEGVSDGRRLVDAIETVSERKPVVVLKVGRADVSDFARSHTGALLGDWTVARAALAQAGAVVVDDLGELVDAAHALATMRLPARRRPGVGVVTAQAGPGLLMADELRAAEVTVPSLEEASVQRLSTLLPPITFQGNPVDTGRPDETFPDVLRTVASDASIDAVVVYALHEPGAVDLADAVEQARVDTLVAVSGGLPDDIAKLRSRLQALDAPLYLAPEHGARAVKALVADARASWRRQRAKPSSPAPSALNLYDAPIDEDRAKTLLEVHGFKAPPRRACDSREAAHAAFAELDTTVVVKALDPRITHKSDVGGVHAGVGSAAALDAALDAIDRLGSSRYLVEQQIADGPELIVGGSRDRSFGPVVVVGLGGVVVEALDRVVVRLAPLSDLDAADMLDELPGRELLQGFRGRPAVDDEELAAAVRRVGDILLAYPEIAELDVNPLRVTADGLVALDALIVRDAASGGGGEEQR